MEQDIKFGLEVQAFLESKIGRYLIGRAEDEIEVAVEKLKREPPTNAEEIRTLQNEIFRAEQIQYWLAEAIEAGINAAREMEERSD